MSASAAMAHSPRARRVAGASLGCSALLAVHRCCVELQAGGISERAWSLPAPRVSAPSKPLPWGRFPVDQVQRPRPLTGRRQQQSKPQPAAVLPAQARKGGLVGLPTLLVLLLVGHKCIVDLLSGYTRVSGEPYSASAAAVVGECMKVPVVLLFVLFFEGRKGFKEACHSAVTDKPFTMMLPGLAYSIQNILYFEALSYVSVGAYQILSQSKVLFTAFFMVIFLKRKLGKKQILAVLLLTAGTILTQLSELPQGGSLDASALWGGFLTLAGALLSALPNVFYEKVLKTKNQNQWASNMQLTFWIWFWLIVISLPSMLSAGTAAVSSGGLLSGFTALVWLVIGLQTLKCILIPATLKHSDNIVYAYSKPLSIVITATAAAGLSGGMPSTSFFFGALLVCASVVLY